MTKREELVMYLTAWDVLMETHFTPALFIQCRYDLFNREFPHPTFSVEQCSPTFFKDTLDIITGVVGLPENKEANVYKTNYINWLKSWML